MKKIQSSIILVFLVTLGQAQTFIVDKDSDCVYIPKAITTTKIRAPALLYLHCQGAKKVHIESIKFVADSVKWIIFSCHKSRNHRNLLENDRNIITTYKKAIEKYPIDSN
ncbi:MAG: hypothetical protein RMJ65_07005, partial [candidate division WOR-3 bacterium]|nr:hypothetical protein [candidate division WOR-3 bacterium]